MNENNNEKKASNEKEIRDIIREIQGMTGKRSGTPRRTAKPRAAAPQRAEAVEPTAAEEKKTHAEIPQRKPVNRRDAGKGEGLKTKKEPTGREEKKEKREGKETKEKKDTRGKKKESADKTAELPSSFKKVRRVGVSRVKRAAVESRESLTAASTKRQKEPTGTLRVIPLGGLGEIGKNMTVLEYGNDIIIIDVGIAFPDEDMLGVDLVIPDISYLVKNEARVRGILITHGHEDHIGAVAYILRQINVPVYGTRLSLGIIEGKLDENPPPKTPSLNTVEAGDVVSLGVFRAEFIHVNHSIADACAIAVRTPVGIVYHSGDFKLDVSPLDGNIMDLTRIGELGREGVKLLLCESTNAERSGFTPSERSVGSSLDRIFTQYEDKRLIVATFSSNVHRVQQIINTSHKHGRKVAVLGRSMVNVISAAVELGYMALPEGVLIDITDIRRYKPEQLTLITTGSQGEPMSALYRIAFDEHDKVKMTTQDVVVLSSSAIPGNEKLIGNIINSLVKSGVKVVNDAVEAVHVSGHACREELKLLMALLKPQYFMPIHGEARHLYANKDIAEFMGIPAQNIFISEIGKVLEIDKKGARFAGTVPSGKILVDGSGVGDIGSVVLRDRKHLSEDGLVVVVAGVDRHEGYIVSGPDIVSRGFVYVKESEKLMEDARRVAQRALTRAVEEEHIEDFAELKNAIRDDLGKFIFRETKRKPMILPIILDV